MKVNIKCSGIEHTPSLDDYVKHKIAHLDKLLKSNHEILVQAELGRTTEHHHKGDIFRAEFNLSIGGELFRAEAQTSDLYAAIDLAQAELTREVKTWKSRRESMFRRGARALKKLILRR